MFGAPDAKVSIGMDAEAAMGMVQRVGLQKVRHVDVKVLWIREQQAQSFLPLRKVPGFRTDRFSVRRSCRHRSRSSI